MTNNVDIEQGNVEDEETSGDSTFWTSTEVVLLLQKVNCV